jgi:mRNA interferase RelE/StbE
MVRYDDEILKNLEKGKLPKEIFQLFYNAFIALDTTKDMNLFDIKKLHSNDKRTYFRLRKNKYRAIFYKDDNDLMVVKIAKREEVYKQWQ